MRTSISDQTSPDSINGRQSVNASTATLGGWLFRHRTSVPIPVALAILFLRVGEAPHSIRLVTAGVVVTAAGEALRLWGVHHIGAISRTRSNRLGPLIASGPFAILRNPLYVGNIALWVGFAVTARLLWLTPAIIVLLGLEYHAIVRWEEQLLESRLVDAYRAYAARVNRWLPTLPMFHSATPPGRLTTTGEVDRLTDPGQTHDSPIATAVSAEPYSGRDTLFSERGTLLAIGAGYLLLWIKARF
jgi:protein-S-isoprenylcysteine O-methyltransferase Ste14